MLDELDRDKWTPEAAAHLLNRAGFGGSPSEIAALHKLGLRGAVDLLISGDEDADLFPPPAASERVDMSDLYTKAKGLSEEEKQMRKKELQRIFRDQTLELRAWWLNRMRWTSHPAREKALLFWHGHWATSIEKVKEPFLMWQQNETLRALALGSFRQMALEISRDPAMMRYLDLHQSKRTNPNENFARELMELFTLGEGHYSEKDISESARAFTGYRVDLATRQFVFQPRQHDGGQKTFFEKTGNLTGDDVLGLILSHPQASKFLARKIWIYYAGSEPSPELLDALAAEYRGSDYDTGMLLAKLWKSREFYEPSVVRRQVKSPVQWLVGTCKMLEISLPGAVACNGILQQLGQIPFAPPNVKGWDGGRAWISSATLLLRYNISAYLLSGNASGLPGLAQGKMEGGKISLEKIYSGSNSPEEICNAAAARLFQSPLPIPLHEKFVNYLSTHGTGAAARQDLLHLMMSTPEFQLT